MVWYGEVDAKDCLDAKKMAASATTGVEKSSGGANCTVGSQSYSAAADRAEKEWDAGYIIKVGSIGFSSFVF